MLGTFNPECTAEEIAAYEKAKQLFDPVETERIAREQCGKGRPLADNLRRISQPEGYDGMRWPCQLDSTMRYDQLVDLWLHAPDRKAITLAANRMDRALLA